METNYLGDEKYWECFENIFDSQSEAADGQGLITSIPAYLSVGDFPERDNNPASDFNDQPYLSHIDDSSGIRDTSRHPLEVNAKVLKGGIKS